MMFSRKALITWVWTADSTPGPNETVTPETFRQSESPASCGETPPRAEGAFVNASRQPKRLVIHSHKASLWL